MDFHQKNPDAFWCAGVLPSLFHIVLLFGKVKNISQNHTA